MVNWGRFSFTGWLRGVTWSDLIKCILIENEITRVRLPFLQCQYVCFSTVYFQHVGLRPCLRWRLTVEKKMLGRLVTCLSELASVVPWGSVVWIALHWIPPRLTSPLTGRPRVWSREWPRDDDEAVLVLWIANRSPLTSVDTVSAANASVS